MYSYLLVNDCTSKYGLLKVHAPVKTDLLENITVLDGLQQKQNTFILIFFFFHNTDMMTILNFTIHS